MDYLERLNIEARLREIDESWGDANMSEEEAAATGSKHEYMAVFEVKPRNSTRNQGIIHEVD